MMVIGDDEIWSDTFPQELIPRLVDLVTNTWETFEKPGPTDLEVPITRKFKHALKQAKDFQKLPVRLEREPAEDDPDTGEELGRIDLKFLPAISAREEIYLAFECKRLNVLDNGMRRTLAPEYVKEGMMRFVTGQYASSVEHGGMIGYVLDGRCDDSIRLIENNISARATDLRMTQPTSLEASSLRPNNNLVRETRHDLKPTRQFKLHHLFLKCPECTSSDASNTEQSPRVEPG